METVRDNVIRIVGDELEELRKRIIARHEAAKQVASGRTRNSLKVELTEDGGILWGRQAFGVLETGRKPGKVPKGFTGIILQWMEDKGIKPKRPKSFAYLVARKIAKEGTLLYRSGETEDIYSTEVQNTVARIGESVAGIFSTEVEHINLNYTQDEKKGN